MQRTETLSVRCNTSYPKIRLTTMMMMMLLALDKTVLTPLLQRPPAARLLGWLGIGVWVPHRAPVKATALLPKRLPAPRNHRHTHEGTQQMRSVL
jgi:hypothetical protein